MLVRKEAANCAGRSVDILIAPAKEIVDLGGLENVLKGQTNSKKITVLAAGEKPKMDLEIAPVHKKIGPIYKGQAKAVVEAIASADPTEVKRQLDGGGSDHILWRNGV